MTRTTNAMFILLFKLARNKYGTRTGVAEIIVKIWDRHTENWRETPQMTQCRDVFQSVIMWIGGCLRLWVKQWVFG